MKKDIIEAICTAVLIILIICILAFALTGCNMRLVGNYKYTRVHIFYPDYEECLEISHWTDSEMGIEVDTKKYGNIFISEGHYLLCKDTCPICSHKNEIGELEEGE